MSKPQRIILYISVFFTGAAVLIIEILGTRIISPFYGSTIFVWTSLITVTLGALSLGYLLGGRTIDRYPALKSFYILVLVSGIVVTFPPKLDQLALPITEQLGLRFGPLLAAVLLFAGPLLLLGMAGPMAIRLLLVDVSASGRTAGRVFAISTIGSIIGGLLAGFYLLPSFSLTAIFASSGGLLAGVGLVGLLFSGQRGRVLLMTAAGIFFAGLLFPKITEQPKDTTRLLYQNQSFFGDIKVVEIYGYKCLYVNGSGQTCVDERGQTDGFFQRFLRDEVPKLGLDGGSRILILGLGGGGILSLLPDMARVDVVELDLEIVNVARNWFDFRDDERIRLIVDDARHFLTVASGVQYDLILENIALGNSVPPYVLSKESWADMKRLLRPGGILLAHIGSHEIEGDNSFNTAVWSTASSLFEYSNALSSQDTQVANLVLYLSDSPIDLKFYGERHPASLVFNENTVMTDEKNLLEYLYQSNAVSQRENIKPFGNQIFYVK